MHFETVDPPQQVIELPDLWATILAPIAVGVLLWLAADWWRATQARKSEKLARRRRIVSLVGRARALAFRAIRDRLYEDAYITSSLKHLADVRREYDDITIEALDLFVEGEEEVAFWTAVELYAGFLDPLDYLEQMGTPRGRNPKGWPLLAPDAEGEMTSGDGPMQRSGYLLPRAERLVGWASMKDPGPRYGDLLREGDKLRHNIVRPNSDGSTDMLRPPIWVRSLNPFAAKYGTEHKSWTDSGDSWS